MAFVISAVSSRLFDTSTKVALNPQPDSPIR
jgi:hypothetical protein